MNGGQQAIAKGLASWPAELDNKGTIANIHRGVLWFDTLVDLKQLRTEAEQAVAAAAQR